MTTDANKIFPDDDDECDDFNRLVEAIRKDLDKALFDRVRLSSGEAGKQQTYFREACACACIKEGLYIMASFFELDDEAHKLVLGRATRVINNTIVSFLQESQQEDT